MSALRDASRVWDCPVKPRWSGRSSWKPTATKSGGESVGVKLEEVDRVGLSQSTKSCGSPRVPTIVSVSLSSSSLGAFNWLTL